MRRKAIALTAGRLATTNAKTTHGLMRGSARFELVGILDEVHAGRHAGEVLDGLGAGVPVRATLAEFMAAPERPECLIIGIATKGGYLPEDMRSIVRDAILAGLDVVNGLHDRLNDDPELEQLAQSRGRQLIDIRRAKPFRELRFWNGEIAEVTAPIVAVLGTDCALGKRTTAKLLAEACASRGLRAEMIYTGQTGWLQGFEYGFIFDATPNDFVCGELEGEVVRCWREAKPDLILLEGQSALRNPSGPCGAEFLLAAQARHVVLQHAPARTHFLGTERIEAPIPSLDEEIALLRFYGAQALAVTLNTEDATQSQIDVLRMAWQAELGIPVIAPLHQSLDPIIDRLASLCAAPQPA